MAQKRIEALCVVAATEIASMVDTSAAAIRLADFLMTYRKVQVGFEVSSFAAFICCPAVTAFFPNGSWFWLGLTLGLAAANLGLKYAGDRLEQELHASGGEGA